MSDGTYYVRVRAKNACGTSAPTSDTTFTIGSTPTTNPGPTPNGTVRVTGYVLPPCDPMPPASGLPGFRNCTGSVYVTVNKTVTSGYVSIFFSYSPDGGSFYHGDVRVTAGRAPGAITIPVRMEYAPACLPLTSLTMSIWDGPQSGGSPTLLAREVVSFKSACP